MSKGGEGDGAVVPTLPRRETLSAGHGPIIIKIDELPTEVVLLIMEQLLKIDPVTLFGSVTGATKKLRALVPMVRGELKREYFDSMESKPRLGALQSAIRLFPRVQRLEAIDKFPIHYLVRNATDDQIVALLDAMTKRFERLSGPEALALSSGGGTDDMGATLLEIACERGLVRVAEVLIKRGADVNSAGDSGFAPLHFACQYRHLEVVRLLLDSGADAEKANNDNDTPLIVACWYGALEVARLLIDRGVDVDKTNDNGVTPLFMACQFNYPDIVRLLIDREADVDKATVHGWTPLFAACQYGLLEVAQLLIEKGADVDKATVQGENPLYIAMALGHDDIVDLLLENGAFVD